MAIAIRVSLPGYNCLTETDISKYSLYADSDNVLIKELSRTSSDVATNPEITHGLGYIPFYILMGKVTSSKYRVANAQNIQAGEWTTFCDTSKIYIDSGVSSYDDYQLYTFYDDFS